MRKRRANNLFVKLIGLLTLILVLFLGVSYLAGTLKRSGFFNIKDIIIRESEDRNFTADLSYLKGRNMLMLDLQKEEQFISQIYPGYIKIKLVRILPDRLFADFIRRKPIAYVKLYRYFCVDEDAVLLEPAVPEQLDLPVISGLETKIFGPKQGQKYTTTPGLVVAITIIKTIRSNKALRDLPVKKIDVADPANASFLVTLANLSSRNLEIKIGGEHINDKIDILGSLLVQAKNDWGNIKYIDLRFKQPVIKFKDNVK